MKIDSELVGIGGAISIWWSKQIEAMENLLEKYFPRRGYFC
ncbi:hypothetical protein [Dapis sp. BLCC M229]